MLSDGLNSGIRISPWFCFPPLMAVSLGCPSQVTATALDFTSDLSPPEAETEPVSGPPAGALPQIPVQTWATAPLQALAWPQEENGHSCFSPGSGDEAQDLEQDLSQNKIRILLAKRKKV